MGNRMVTAFIVAGEKRVFPGFGYVEQVLTRALCIIMEDVLPRSLICGCEEVADHEGVLQTFSVKDGSIALDHSLGAKSEVASLWLWGGLT